MDPPASHSAKGNPSGPFVEGAPDTKQEVVDKDHIEIFRIKVKKFMNTTSFGRAYADALMVLSVLSCFLFIYLTYGHEDLVMFDIIEMALASLFSFDWLLSFFIADHRVEFVNSFFSMVDLLTVIPIWITFNSKQVTYPEVKSFHDMFLYFLFGLNTTRILRALRIHKKLMFVEDEVARALGNIILTVVVMLLFGSAVMQYLEEHEQHLPFHTWMYAVWVTVSTVGFGDISPSSPLGRMAVMIIIGFAVIQVPKMTNDLLAKMALTSVYARVVYIPKKNSTHVIVCGDLASTSMREFFVELFHEDHEAGNTMALILQPHPPSFEMLQLINENQFALNVMYVEGSALNNRDLRRCCADTSVAIFVMTNKFADNADEEDAKTILQQFSIRRYCQSNNPFTPPFYCLQLIRPENQRHLEIQGDSVNAFADNDNDSNVIVCLNEIKMGLIGKAVMYPGSAALLMNLLTTIDDDNDDEDEGESFDEEDDVGIWLDEYHRGCDWEIYSTELADMFVGRKFNTLACDLYTSKGILLFALKVVDTSGKFPTRILVNPKNYVIPSKDEYDVVAYVIAKNKNASDLSMKKDDDQDASAALQHLQLSNMMGGRIGPMTGPPDDDDHPLEEDHESVADYVRGRVRSYTADSSNLPGDKEPLEWQKLMRMYDTEKNANESQQEKMQKIEDEYLRANFFMRDSPASLSQVTVHTSVLDEIPNMTNHTIILGKGLSNLFDLIRPLRARSMDNVKCIVILNPLDIPHAVWQRICLFEGIFFVRGSPLEDNDLRRAGIFRAAQVIVLADTQGEKSFGTAAANARGDVAMYDADSIFSFQAVRRLNEKAHCVVEIVKHANIVYLDPESVSSSEGDYRFSPQFAAGTLFTTAMLDTLACQVFYNPQIIKLINKLISSADCKTKDELAMARGTGKEAKGLTAVQSSSLYQIPIPDNLDSRTYGALVRHLTAMGTIPVGLFRGVFQQMKVGPKHNKMPYAYTNPPKDTELFSCDRVFVLSPAPPHTTKLKDVERELQSAEENLIRTSLGARVTVEATAAAMRDQFNIFGANQAIVRRHVDDLGANVKAKLDKVNFAVKKLKEKVKNEETRSVKPVEHKFASRARSATAGAESDSYNASIFRRSGIFGESSRRSSVSSNSGEDLNRRFHRPSDEWEELSIGPPKSDIGTPSVRGKRTSSVDVASYRDRQKSVGFATP